MMQRLFLIRKPNSINFISKRFYTSKYEQIMNDLFEDLKKDKEKLKNKDTENSQQNATAAWMAELSARLKEANVSRPTVNVPPSVPGSIPTRLSEAESTMEIKTAISQFIEAYFPEDPKAEKRKPKPLLLAVAIYSCRRYKTIGMANALMNFIQSKPVEEKAQWIDTNVVNEMCLLEWESTKNLELFKNTLKMMEEYGLAPNTQTLLILKNIQKDINDNLQDFDKAKEIVKLTNYVSGLNIYKI